jgi:hypothetical protein
MNSVRQDDFDQKIILTFRNYREKCKNYNPAMDYFDNPNSSHNPTSWVARAFHNFCRQMVKSEKFKKFDILSHNLRNNMKKIIIKFYP